MKRFQKCCFSLPLVWAVLVSVSVTAFAAVSDGKLEQAAAVSGQYILETVQTPQVGSIGGEWAVLGLARGGYDVPQEYWDSYYAAVEEYVTSREGVLHEKKYTEYSRLIVALTAIGADPADVAGYNLLTALGDYEKTIWQGLNGPIWALIALDSGNYDMPLNPEAQTQATRQMYIDRILTCRLPDGGWSLLGGTESAGAGDSFSDPDITGMALQALAKYRDQEAVEQAVEEALDCMSRQQGSDGGFASWGTENSESCVQMLVALCELGIPLDDARFVKNGNTILDALLRYRQADGGFLHTAGSGADQVASEQGLYGLAAALRAAEGRSSLYRMDDVTISVSGNPGAAAAGLPGKDPDVTRVPVTAPGTVFADVSGHKNQTAIEALACRGIINGRGSGLFDPDDDMTRAEFAAIVVRALGLTPRETDAFTDVADGDWFAAYVGTACSYGIVNGVGTGRFNPNGTVTRQEAAVMVARAAVLCGMETGQDAAAVRDVLAQFSDYMTAADWARQGLAFCYREGIFDDSALELQAAAPIKRCEVAQMLFNLLGSAKLL